MAAPIKDGLTNQQRHYWKDPEAARARSRAWYHANPDKCRKKTREHKQRKAVWQRKSLGLPEPTRPEPDGCEGCGKTRTERWRQSSLCADHDHVTGKFRGWLCTSCNIGIGNLGDTLAGVERAAAYLRRNT